MQRNSLQFLTTFDLHDLHLPNEDLKKKAIYVWINFGKRSHRRHHWYIATFVLLCISFIASLIHFSRLIFSHSSFSYSTSLSSLKTMVSILRFFFLIFSSEIFSFSSHSSCEMLRVRLLKKKNVSQNHEKIFFMQQLFL